MEEIFQKQQLFNISQPITLEYSVSKESLQENATLMIFIKDDDLDVYTDVFPLTEMKTNLRSLGKNKELHFFPTLEIYVSNEFFVFDRSNIPVEFHTLLKMYSNSDRLEYLPLFFSSSIMRGLNESIPTTNDSENSINFWIRINPVSIGTMRLYLSLHHTFTVLKGLGFKEKDFLEVKSLLLDTSYYLLSTIMVVAIIHLLFDFLSIQSDISFWKENVHTAGLSKRTILWNCLSSTVILLYLHEEKGSLLVTVPVLFKVLVEYWKLLRVTKTHFSFRKGFVHETKNSDESQTEVWDQESTRILSWLLIPLLVCCCVYSYVYQPYVSLYSWTISTLAKSVYAFGFLLMTPQLFINYRMKSVAHLPWRALTYRAFNTFIDDFFAFVVYMPTSHRLACLRDDVVFIIYLYQRWLYPVDHKRSMDSSKKID